MNHTINDSFMNPDRLGFTVVPFKLDGCKEPPKYVPEWRVNRSRSRSMGRVSYLHTKPTKCCNSLVRRVYDNSCFECFKRGKK